MPLHGWVCFHCGEEFSIAKNGSANAAHDAAREHFGPDPQWKPACLDLLRTRPAKLYRRLRLAEMRLVDMGGWDMDDYHELEAQNVLLIREKDRQHNLIDSLEGRALTAEDVVARIAREPGGAALVESARDASCRDGFLKVEKTG